jgi:phage gpG-like protein
MARRSNFRISKSDLGLSRVPKSFDIKSQARFNPGITIDVDQKGKQQLKKRKEEAMRKSLAELTSILDAALLAAISSTWPNGSDIVDTGNLLNSNSVVLSGDTIEIINTAPYAKLIHFGGYITPYGNPFAERVYIPPRPWVTAVLEGTQGQQQVDLASVYKQAFTKVFR